jgi:hypothetical protein
MSKKSVSKASPIPASETEGPPAPPAVQDAVPDTGIMASIKNAKDFVVDKMSHPKETAGEVKEWAERSAHTVDAALEGAQDALATVNSSIGQAREWTADKADQVDRILAGAQGIVAKLDESVEAVQSSTNRAADALHEAPETASAPPAGVEEEPVTLVDLPDDDAVEPDGAWGPRTDPRER